MKIKKTLLVLLALCLFIPSAFGTNWYVNKFATGTNAGTTWTNGWNEMNQINWSSVACGDTIWVAGAAYTTGIDVAVSKVCTSGTVINVNRVLVSDSVPVAATGWVGAYDTTVTLPNINVEGPAAYITFNGRIWINNVPGMQIIIPGTTGDGIDGGVHSFAAQAIDHITWEYIGITGPACVTSGTCTGGGVIGINIMPFCAGAIWTNLLFDHMIVYRTGESVRGCGQNGTIIQNSIIDDTANDGQQHEDLLYSNPPYENVTWRYNKIFLSPNDGIFFEGTDPTAAQNFALYGNMIYHSGGSLMTTKPETGSATYGPIFLYNNVFENDGTFGDFQPGWLAFDNLATGSKIENNVFENINSDNGGMSLSGIADYNAYSTGMDLDPGTHSFHYNPGTLGASTMFVGEAPTNPIAADFHLTALGKTTFATGLALSAPYNVDADGVTRGTNGWTIGAYQTAPVGTTWYVRPDGGGRSDAGRLTGSPQGTSMGHYTVGCAVNSTTCLSAIEVGCDGKADVSYAAAVAAAGGAIISLHCAFNDPRFLWDDMTFDDLPGMIVQGGDTVIIRGGPWRIGEDAQPGSCSGPRCGAGDTWNFGGPTPNSLFRPWPSGTPGAHTQVFGENYASCNTGPDWTQTTKSALTQLYGGWSLETPFSLQGSSYVDVKCFEITRHSNCVSFGSPALPLTCDSTQDYDSNGVETDSFTHDVTMTDMWIHGHVGRGVKGGLGGTLTCTRCNIDTNGAAGWDFDDGTTHLIAPQALWVFNYSVIRWNGCNQEYPFVDAIPVTSCYGQSNGGYGDGVGSPSTSGLSASIDHSKFLFNTQDALDLGHVDTGGPFNLTITNSLVQGNNGGGFKWGGNFGNVVFTNNVSITDCNRMAVAMTGAPSSYNAHLGDFCRSSDGSPFDFRHNTQILFANNTLVTYFPTLYDLQCWDDTAFGGTGAGCTNTSFIYKNNLNIAYSNPAASDYGGNSGPGLWFFESTIAGIVDSNNIYYNFGHGFTCTGTYATDLCSNPLLVGQPTGTAGTFVEGELDNFNANLTSSSPAIGAGITYTGVPTLDYFGKTQTTPPVIGAAIFSTTTPAFIRMLGARVLGRIN